MGKGAVGLVARPTAGIVDFASGTFDSVKRATELSDEAMKLRPPRFMHADGVVRPFSKMEAEGNKVFKEVDKGKYVSSDQFSYFEIIIEGKDVLILTNHRIIYAVKNDLFGGWQVRYLFLPMFKLIIFICFSFSYLQSEWIHRWEEINSSRVCENGVEIKLEQPKSKSTFSKMFSASDKSKKILLIQNRKRCEKLVVVMETLRNRFGKN